MRWKVMKMKYIFALVLLCCIRTAAVSNEDIPISKHQKAINDSIQQVFYKDINKVIAPIFEIPQNILSGWPRRIKSAPQCKCCNKYYYRLSTGSWLSFIYADSLSSNELDFYTDKINYDRLTKRLLNGKFKLGSNWIGDTFEFGSISISYYGMENMPKDDCLENQFKSNPYCFRIIPKIRH
jgi:hypothetical protein